MEKKEWEALLDKANENLKKYGAELTVGKEKGDTYRMDVRWTDGDWDNYALGHYEDELAGLINEAWPEVRIKSRRRGDRIIRVIVHVDTSDDGFMTGCLIHNHAFCGSEESALRTMNDYLDDVLDNGCTMTTTEDLIAVNAALAEKYDDPMNENAYAIIEDITEEVIIKCSELFCEHHWNYEALRGVADELGIDLYDIEKS